MLVSTKGRYATRMLIDIAMHQEDGYVAMKDIAERQQISKKYMEAFTAPLAGAGILGIRRGKNGGYRLLLPPDQITLWDILSATEGSLHAVSCLEQSENPCARCEFCISLPAWEGLEKTVQTYLKSVTLQELIRQAKPQPEDPGMFPCGI